MTKITSDHLARSALVYVRQSTADQVLNHHESRRRQYALVERTRALGWAAVEVIDDDLGRSGSGIARPGFEKLLAAICQGRVGAVVSIEASRLARNGRDWHTLLEFCGLVGTLILDEDGVYDPRHPNDRLLLGMKGTMSEMELSLFRQRSLEALKQKARRGELFLTVAVGYLKVTHDRIDTRRIPCFTPARANRRCSSTASLTSGPSGQVRPAAFARARLSCTVERAMPSVRPISRELTPSWASRSICLICRMVSSLLAGIPSSSRRGSECRGC